MTARRVLAAALVLLAAVGCTPPPTPPPGRCICDTGWLPDPRPIPTTTTGV